MDNILDEKFKEPSAANIVLQKIKYISAALGLILICYGDTSIKSEEQQNTITPPRSNNGMFMDRDTLPKRREFEREKVPFTKYGKNKKSDFEQTLDFNH